MRFTASLLAGVAVIASLAAAGCGGGSAKDGGADTSSDKGTDTGHDTPGTDTTGSEVATDVPTDTPTDTERDAGADGDAADTGPDVAPGSDGGDAPADMAPGNDATDGNNDGTDGNADAADATDAPQDVPPVVLTLFVDAVQNRLPLDTCNAVPATFADVPAGMHTLQLIASTLSKGSVMSNEMALDPYVIVHAPLPPGDPMENLRFFMLNGVGASRDITLPAIGTIGMFFIDSDAAFNSGQGDVSLTPDGTKSTVDAVTNVIHWTEGCATTPATLTVSDRSHRATLIASTLSSGTGAKDDFVLLKLPSERPMDDHRFVMLNGVGSSVDFAPSGSLTLRAWFLTASGGTGLATVQVTDL